ncbi:transporter [Pseudomonas oryzihabitans]|uniref:transporter n=1 Tax=Pseudomonas oryzihabitans TaxID=47885 RepID=UPI002854DD77|nr:transporter [Pseudomonas psychrotolerans]MDR6678716.1 lactate permease [Pseudomonas psychrotolerans]
MVATLLHLAPIGLVLALILLARRPPVQAALAGVVLAALLWVAGLAEPLSLGVAQAILCDTTVLFLSTASVILPGLAFVILVERAGAPQAIGAWVRALGWPPAAQVLFIVLGLAPLLEAMTGFGVSLIATVPLLMSLFSRPVGMRLALTGMAIMPWGTLGLATVIGALLAGVPAATLGSHSALLSAPVFFCLSGLALWQARVSGAWPWCALGLLGTVFVAVLFAINRWLGPELAGVAAGLIVTGLGLGSTLVRYGRLPPWPREAWPYLALLGLILAWRGLCSLSGWDALWVIRGQQVSWKPLASPGLALALVTLLQVCGRTASPALPWAGLVRRARVPLTTILLFLLLSQILVKAGFLLETQRLLQAMSGLALAPTLALLAGLAGYLTGSNVGGNSLIMPVAATLDLTHGPWLAALVNSAAGHGALGSLSILALIVGLAGANRREEQQLVRFAFGLVCLNILLVAAAGSALLYGLGSR